MGLPENRFIPGAYVVERIRSRLYAHGKRPESRSLWCERRESGASRGEKPLRIILLGATGAMGRRAAEILARSPEVEELTLTGRRIDAVRGLAREIGGPSRAIRLDVGDRGALVAALKGHHVAAGAIGPYYLYETHIAQAAIEAKVPYVSICDDHDAAQAVLSLDGLARERGVTILTGAGWTPGLTNILAKMGVSMLDEAKKVHIAWVGALADADGIASLLHALHIFTGDVPSFAHGRQTTVRAGTGKQIVTFPHPIGRVDVYHTGHPEPITIPRFIPGLEEVTLRGGLNEALVSRLTRLLTRLGLTKTPASREGLLRFMQPFLPLIQKISGPPKPISAAHVAVHGMKDQKPAVVEMAAIGRMRDLTALPHAVATLMVGRGEVSAPGVIAPEAPGGPDPDRFLTALRELGLTIETRRRLQ